MFLQMPEAYASLHSAKMRGKEEQHEDFGCY